MNAVRRTAVLLGLAVALVIGSSIPASAAWSASTAQKQASLKVAAAGMLLPTTTAAVRPSRTPVRRMRFTTGPPRR